MQQINCTGNLDRVESATMLFIITILDFSLRTVRV